MSILPLSPLPCPRDDAAPQSAGFPDAGFVDDSVVLALVSGVRGGRMERAPWVLTADEFDFAGWGCATAGISAAQQAEPARRATAPELAEAGIGEPHRGRHRWWLAGIAGAISSLLASALLLVLAERPPGEERELTIIRAAPIDQAAPAADESSLDEPDLTRLGDEP